METSRNIDITASNQTIENLVFEGGGVKGIAYVGAIRALEKQQKLASLQRIAGASAGAIVSLLLSLGLNSDTIEKLMMENKLEEIFKDSKRLTGLGNFVDIVEKFGIHPGDESVRWTEEIIRQCLGKDNATFEDLHLACLKQSLSNQQYKELYIIGTNLSTGFYEVFSHEHTPDMPLSIAVRISMSIPFFFQAIRHGEYNDLYVDGGVLNNYPIDLFDKAGEKNVHTLGFRVDPPEEIAALTKFKQEHKQINDFMGYGAALKDAVLNATETRFRMQDENFRTVYIDTLDVATTNFAISKEKQQELIAQGELATRRHLTGYRNSILNSLSYQKHADYLRLEKYDRYKLYAKASSINLREMGDNIQLQFIFPSEQVGKIKSYINRFSHVHWIKQLNYCATTESTPRLVLECIIQNNVDIKKELKQWLEKNNQLNKLAIEFLKQEQLIVQENHRPALLFTQLTPKGSQSEQQALYQAVYKKSFDKAQQLLSKGVSGNYKDKHGRSALSCAVENKDLLIITLLLNYPDLVNINATDNIGETGLHVIMDGDYKDLKRNEIATLLLSHGAEVNLKNRYGATPLHRAARYGLIDIVKSLVKAGASIIDVDNNDKTALDYASNYPDVVEFLQEQQALRARF